MASAAEKQPCNRATLRFPHPSNTRRRHDGGCLLNLFDQLMAEANRPRLRSEVSEPLCANASVPSQAPPGFPAHMAYTCSGDADITNSRMKRPASKGDLRDHVVVLVDGRGCHCLRRCCDG
jgi:hypothetical protein